MNIVGVLADHGIAEVYLDIEVSINGLRFLGHSWAEHEGISLRVILFVGLPQLGPNEGGF